MVEKIINAIQYIRTKSKQGVTWQRIFTFIIKVELTIDCELSLDCMNSLATDGRIYKQ